MDILGFHIPSLVGVGATFASVYGAFAQFDKDQSDDNRHFIRDWLLGLNVDDRKWKQFFDELFAAFFGSKHLSAKCVKRSFLLSATLITAIYTLGYVEWLFSDQTGKKQALTSVELVLWAISLPCGCIADYLSLWKTRILLTRLNSFRNGFIAVAIVIGDIVATTLIFMITYFVVIGLITWAFFGSFGFFMAAEFGFDIVLGEILSGTIGTFWLLYFAALFTSAWLWVYLVVAYGLRMISHVPFLLKPISRVLDFEEHPVRTLGYIAATFSASIVLIARLT